MAATSPRLRLTLKLVLLVLALSLGYAIYLSRLQHLYGTVSALFYLFLLFLSVSSILCVAFGAGHFARLFWGVLFFVSWVAYDSHTRTTGNHLIYSGFFQLFDARESAYFALSQYTGAILASIPAGLLVLFGTVINPHLDRESRSRLPRMLMATAPVAPIVVLMMVLFFRGGFGSGGLPAGIVMPAFVGLLAYENLEGNTGTREEINIGRGPSAAPFRDIILIVDESVRGDYLDINSAFGVYSGLSTSNGSIEIIDFGLAAAATNCSAGSNLILRFGGTRKQYRRYINTMPSIWHYAKHAGLESVYIDAQSEQKLYTNITEEELSIIDRFIRFPDVAPAYRDLEAAKSVVDLTRDQTMQFVMVNKLGAHFPINDKYPNSHMSYLPALSRGKFTDTPLGKLSESFNGDWDRYKNSYKNTIKWSVGRFFDYVLARADLDNAIIVYTSDHGQSFHERGEPGLSTHCSLANTAIEEGVVPMVVIAGKTPDIREFRNSVRNNRDRTSHYNVFPTLLGLMGFDRDAVRRTYGLALSEAVSDPFTFNARFHARLGQDPIWIDIDLTKIARPTQGRQVATGQSPTSASTPRLVER